MVADSATERMNEKTEVTDALSGGPLPPPSRIHPIWSDPARRSASDATNTMYPGSGPEDIEQALRDRILLSASCHDTDRLPRVEHAGEVLEFNNQRVQIMHNGVRIVEDCYCGSWMTETIRLLRGFHEPQEETVFHAMIERLRSEKAVDPVIIEFGSYWAYYSLWFLRELPSGRAIAVEPDPEYLEVGRVNARINGATERMTFVHGAVGSAPGERLSFVAQSDGNSYDVQQYDLGSLMDAVGVTRADIVLADIQGHESNLLERAALQLASGGVRFFVISTHQHSISGDALTHQKVLRLLVDAGAHLIAEHSVPESFSGDGLIAVSFDPADADFQVEISRARAKDSIFGELEFDLAAEVVYRESVRRRLAEENWRLRTERDTALTELRAMQQTRLWRWASRPRSLYSQIRSRIRMTD